MDLLNLLLSRRSIRRYTESPIPQRALEAFCRALLSVPARYTLEAILSLGFPAIQPEPHSLEDLPREKIHWDTF